VRPCLFSAEHAPDTLVECANRACVLNRGSRSAAEHALMSVRCSSGVCLFSIGENVADNPPLARTQI